MGERGAPPDPLNSGLYCRHCASKYCSCDGYGNTDDYWSDFYADDNDTDSWTADNSADQGEAGDNAETPQEESAESEGWTVGDTVAVGALVVGTGAAIAVAGPLVGIGLVVAGFAGGTVIGRIFGK